MVFFQQGLYLILFCAEQHYGVFVKTSLSLYSVSNYMHLEIKQYHPLTTTSNSVNEIYVINYTVKRYTKQAMCNM